MSHRPSPLLPPTVLVLVAALLLAPVVPADASPGMHLQLTRSAPADGATVSAAPEEIRLWFSQKPEHAVSMIRLQGPGGEVELGEVQAGDENTLFAALVGSLEPGDYTVHWRTSSGDGHPIRGSFAFTLTPSR